MTAFSSQPDETAGIDALLYEPSPTTNYGSYAKLEFRGVGAGGRRERSLLKFDISSIPAGATISSAVLSLWKANAASGSQAMTIAVYRQKRAWVENQVTWNVYSTGNSWATAGGFGADDCEQTEIGSVSTNTGDALNTQYDITLTAATKEDLDLGNGWLLKFTDETMLEFVTIQVNSSNGSTAGYRPKLAITYSEAPSGVPKQFMYYQRLRSL